MFYSLCCQREQHRGRCRWYCREDPGFLWLPCAAEQFPLPANAAALGDVTQPHAPGAGVPSPIRGRPGVGYSLEDLGSFCLSGVLVQTALPFQRLTMSYLPTITSTELSRSASLNPCPSLCTVPSRCSGPNRASGVTGWDMSEREITQAEET